jgi:hypothetical protein
MKKSHRLLLLALPIAFVAAACGTSGAPEEYNDTTEKNYTDGCQVALDEDPQASPANEVCACAYAEIKRTIPFEDFKELDDDLRNDVNAIAESQTGRDVTMIVADCIQGISSS